MSYRLLAVALAVLAVGSFAGLSAAEESLSWGFGSVVSVNPESNRISISEYDYESESEKTTEYVVNEETEFAGGASLSGIAVGSEVSIEYKPGAGGNIATYIDAEGEEAYEEFEEEYEPE